MAEPPGAPDGWPFLVARGRRKGYRVLLVPGLLADHGLPGLLAEALGGGFSPSVLPQVETVAAPGIGAVCCAYRTERLTNDQLDEHGRPLEILYGVMCATDRVLDADPADLDDCRAQALATYSRCLADESGFTPERSRAMPLRSTLSPVAMSTAAPAALLEEPGPPQKISAHAPSRFAVGGGLAVAALAIVVVALAAVAWALLFRSPDGRVVYVRVQEPNVADVECGQYVSLRVDATVATDGEARVVFHWEDQLDGWTSDRAEVAFDGDGSKGVHVSREVRVSRGDSLPGSVSLVVDEPNLTSGTSTYTLTCDGP